MGPAVCLQLGLENPEGEQKKVIWVDCGIHAREWIAPAFCQWFVKEVCTLPHKFMIHIFTPAWKYTLTCERFFFRLSAHIEPMRSWSGCCRTSMFMLLLWSMWMDTYSPGPMTAWGLLRIYYSGSHFSSSVDYLKTPFNSPTTSVLWLNDISFTFYYNLTSVPAPVCLFHLDSSVEEVPFSPSSGRQLLRRWPQQKFSRQLGKWVACFQESFASC